MESKQVEKELGHRNGEVIWEPTVWRCQQLSGNMDKVLLSQSPQILQKTMFFKRPERSREVVWRESCHLSCTVEQARPTLFIPLDDLNFNRLQRQNSSFTAQTCLPNRGQEIPTSQHRNLCCGRTPSTEQGGNQSRDHTSLYLALWARNQCKADLPNQKRGLLSYPWPVSNVALTTQFPVHTPLTELVVSYLLQAEFKLK